MSSPYSPEEMRHLENDADLSIAVLWACATHKSSTFANGGIDGVSNSYYAFAHGAAFVAVSKWLLADYHITHGYDRNAKSIVLQAVPVVAERILFIMADVGPEPVRALRRMATEQHDSTDDDGNDSTPHELQWAVPADSNND